MDKRRLIILFCFLPSVWAQCQIAGIDSWVWPYALQAVDTDRGEIFRATTTNINSIQSAQHSGDALNGGPYFAATLDGGDFVLSLSDAFADYEELEYTQTMNIQVIFGCNTGTTPATLIISITVQDTNNNAPRFLPSDEYTFTILPPVVPGYELTGCHGDLVVRDIDLTTQGIVFSIQDNPYFEIEYGGRDASDSKNFNAILRAVSVIRTLDEPLVLQISAQDIDTTGDPPLTSYATITITSDAEFELPAEPVFSQAYYTIEYTSQDTLVSEHDIHLVQGYDDEVSFTLDSEYNDYFVLSPQGNSVSLSLLQPLPTNILTENGHVALVVRAVREFTSGAVATLIITFSGGSTLEFEEASYEGSITDGVLSLPALVVVTTADAVAASVLGVHSEYFSTTVNGNTIQVTTSGLPDQVLQQNSFISLTVTAAVDDVTAHAVLILDIIEDDYSTPVFSRDIFEGSYDTAQGLLIEEIYLTQGYDDTVVFSIEGDDSQYFSAEYNGNSITLIASGLPDETLSRVQLSFSVRASKERTVGAAATVLVALPGAIILRFEDDRYIGRIEEGELEIASVVLVEGDSEQVVFSLLGDFSEYFVATSTNNVVTLNSLSPLPPDVIEVNSFITLTLEASASGAASARTVIILELIRQEIATPAFQQLVYNGVYTEEGAVVEGISLAVGYDASVAFDLVGDYSQYFSVDSSFENAISIAVSTPLPTDLLLSETRLLLTIVAEKPGATAANAAVDVLLPQVPVLRFSDSSYLGTLVEQNIDLQTITLTEGFSADVLFRLTGVYAQYFTAANNGNEITIELSNTLPIEVVDDNSVIIINLEAYTPTSFGSTVIVLDVVKDNNDLLNPQFSAPFYTGSYTMVTELLELNEIIIIENFDESVTVSLDGANSQWFTTTITDNVVTLLLLEPIPNEVIAENYHLIFTVVATKPGTAGASAAISITLPDDLSTVTILRFQDDSYVGKIEDDVLELETIILENQDVTDVSFNLIGDYASLFSTSTTNNLVTLTLTQALPAEVISDNVLIVLGIEASSVEAISGRATIILEIVKNYTIAVPLFSETFYRGTYTVAEGLTLFGDILVSEGFDETVSVNLVGDSSQWFTTIMSNNVITLLLLEPIPNEVIAENYHLIFSVVATKPGTAGASAAISITLPDDLATVTILRFQDDSYVGKIEDDVLELETIILENEDVTDVSFNLFGDYASLFSTSTTNNLVTLTLTQALPAEVISDNVLIVLGIEASSVEAISGRATIILEIVKNDDTIAVPLFSETFYSGRYTAAEGLTLFGDIVVAEGFDETVSVNLVGDSSQWFTTIMSNNVVTLLLLEPIPNEVIAENYHLIFSVVATKSGTAGASAAISITLPDDLATVTILRFQDDSYVGKIEDDVLELETIILENEDVTDVSFNLIGDYAPLFSTSTTNNLVILTLNQALPAEVISDNVLIVLGIEASSVEAISGRTTIILEIVKNDDTITVPLFSETFYSGRYTAAEGLTLFGDIVVAEGFDETVSVNLVGDSSQWFTTIISNNVVTLLLLEPIPNEVIAENYHFIFSVVATKPGTAGASAAISITLPDDLSTVTILRFQDDSYVGKIEDDVLELETIILENEDVTDVSFNLIGDYASLFSTSTTNNLVTLTLNQALPAEVISDNVLIVLGIEASSVEAISGRATIILEIVKANSGDILLFSQSLYTGNFVSLEGLLIDTSIYLVQGYEESVTFEIYGDDSQFFTFENIGSEIILSTLEPIPNEVILRNHYLVFTIIANKPGFPSAESTVLISLPEGTTEATILFEEALYHGQIEQGVVTHSPIQLYGYGSTEIQIIGDYSDEFSAVISEEGLVVISLAEDWSLPDLYVTLVLQASTARTALVITIIEMNPPEPPTVSFESSTYVIRTDVSQSGVVGAVAASADNGETLAYTLLLYNNHLEERLTINDNGELILSAPANSGLYEFQVQAVTVTTQISAMANVYMTVDSVVMCGTHEKVLPPLIIIERDEEESHENLVILNEDLAQDCSFDFTYRWPIDRDWLYINDQGHVSTTAIDREDSTIAFMPVSQVQIELLLICVEDENISKTNRSRRDLGPYDYGMKSWVLTEGISFNARRSFVNLIVNDINDNAPIFVGKENEPFVVGYPVADILDDISPSPLVTVRATDADIGINAELVYWTSSSELVVSPQSGSVYVSDHSAATIQTGQIFTISATDLAGHAEGLTGEIDIMIRRLLSTQIAVLTIRNNVLENVEEIVQQLSEILQYEIKALKSTVVSLEYEAESSMYHFPGRRADEDFIRLNEIHTNRKKRQAEINGAGASLRIFIYGLVNTEPVETTQLISDIQNSNLHEAWTANYRIQDLQEHLDDISGGTIHDSNSSNAYFISTIILSSVLGLLVILLIGWYFIWRKRKNNYQQFSDTSSQNSNQTIDRVPKVDDPTRPTINIEEIKRSERRLQTILDQAIPAKVSRTDIESTNTLDQEKAISFETVDEVIKSDRPTPIVIQSIGKLKSDTDSEDDDEYGERAISRRKSVVTFNENVERIIHVENDEGDDDEEEKDFQVFKF